MFAAAAGAVGPGSSGISLTGSVPVLESGASVSTAYPHSVLGAGAKQAAQIQPQWSQLSPQSKFQRRTATSTTRLNLNPHLNPTSSDNNDNISHTTPWPNPRNRNHTLNHNRQAQTAAVQQAQAQRQSQAGKRGQNQQHIVINRQVQGGRACTQTQTRPFGPFQLTAISSPPASFDSAGQHLPSSVSSPRHPTNHLRNIYPNTRFSVRTRSPGCELDFSISPLRLLCLSVYSDCTPRVDTGRRMIVMEWNMNEGAMFFLSLSFPTAYPIADMVQARPKATLVRMTRIKVNVSKPNQFKGPFRHSNLNPARHEFRHTDQEKPSPDLISKHGTDKEKGLTPRAPTQRMFVSTPVVTHENRPLFSNIVNDGFVEMKQKARGDVRLQDVTG
ncbi:hypothetical protein BU17DRAFT_91804 [Hysterangium stoloniferum]|nr:hypothetical protein BU17DRAFT_91804 [Hysterangium stoloniferum]